MISHDIEICQLNNLTMKEAFELIFGENTLRKVHGVSLMITPWQNNKRKLDFYLQIDTIPKILKDMFCASGFHITCNQTLSQDNIINNDIILHCIGSNLIRIISSFHLQEITNKIYLSGNLKIYSNLFTPIDSLIESFIFEQCKKEIDNYRNIIINIYNARKLVTHTSNQYSD